MPKAPQKLEHMWLWAAAVQHRLGNHRAKQPSRTDPVLGRALMLGAHWRNLLKKSGHSCHIA